jgi:hypothetical protein
LVWGGGVGFQVWWFLRFFFVLLCRRHRHRRRDPLFKRVCVVWVWLCLCDVCGLADGIFFLILIFFFPPIGAKGGTYLMQIAEMR